MINDCLIYKTLRFIRKEIVSIFFFILSQFQTQCLDSVHIKQQCAKYLLFSCMYIKSCRISEENKLLSVGVIIEDCVKKIICEQTLKKQNFSRWS